MLLPRNATLLCTALDEVGSGCTANDTIRVGATGQTHRHRARTGKVPDAGSTRAQDITHGYIAVEHKFIAVGGEPVPLKNNVVVQSDVGSDVVVVPNVIADATAVEDEATAAERKVVADAKRGVGIDADVTSEAHIPGGQSNEPRVPVHKGGGIPCKIAGLSANFHLDLICRATSEDIFKQAGAARIDQDGANIEGCLGFHLRRARYLPPPAAPRVLIEIIGIILLRVAQPPIATRDGGHVQRFTVITIVQSDHTSEGSSGFHLDLACSGGSTGDDRSQIQTLLCAKPIPPNRSRQNGDRRHCWRCLRYQQCAADRQAEY